MQSINIRSLVFHRNGTFLATDYDAEGFYLWLGCGYGLFKQHHKDDVDGVTYQLSEVSSECCQSPYSVIQTECVLWSRQEALLADQQISAYRHSVC